MRKMCVALALSMVNNSARTAGNPSATTAAKAQAWKFSPTGSPDGNVPNAASLCRHQSANQSLSIFFPAQSIHSSSFLYVVPFSFPSGALSSRRLNFSATPSSSIQSSRDGQEKTG